MLTRNVTGTEGPREILGGNWWTGSITAALIAALLCWVVRNDKVSTALPAGAQAKSSVLQIGKILIADWVVPFEVMAVLLTAALIGAVVIALEEVRRRR
jgi:NADH-quinone oxidoreductase subunit J